MSTNVKGIAEIELKSDRFTKPAKEAQKSLKDLETKGKQSFRQIDQATDKTSNKFTKLSQTGKQSMQNIQQATTQTQNTFTQFSAQGKNAFEGITTSVNKTKGDIVTMGQVAAPALDKAANSMHRLGANSKRTAAEINGAKAATAGMIGSLAGLGTSLVALETTFTNVPKRAKAIEQAQVGLERATNLLTTKTIALDKAELKLQRLREKGMTQSAEMEIALAEQARLISEIATAEADLAVKATDVELKHADMADTLKLLGSSIFTTILTTGTSLMIMLGTMATAAGHTTGEFVRLKIATLANSNALKFLKIDLINARANFLGYSSAASMSAGAGVKAATGIKRVGLAFKGLFVAMGPIGWAILGITAVWEAWNSNLFGFQNIIHDVSKQLKEILEPVLETLAKIVSFFTGQTYEMTNAWESFSNVVFPPLYPELQKAEAATEDLTEDIDALTDASEMQLEAMIDMGHGMATVASQAGGFSSNLETATRSMMRLREVSTENWTKTVEEFDKMNPILQETLNIVSGGLSATLRSFEEGMVENYKLVYDQIDDFTSPEAIAGIRNLTNEWQDYADQMVELHGPEATRERIRSLRDIRDEHKEMIISNIRWNDKQIESNKAVGASIDELKKKAVSDARELEKEVNHIQNRLDREAANNRALGVSEDRNISGDWNIRRALGIGEDTFGRSSAFVARAGQFDNPFGIDPNLPSDRALVLSQFRQRNNRNNQRFAESSPSGSSRQYGGTSSFGGRTLTRAKGKKGRKGSSRPPKFTSNDFLRMVGLNTNPPDLLNRRLNARLTSRGIYRYELPSYITRSVRNRRGMSAYEVYARFKNLIHRSIHGRYFGPNWDRARKLRQDRDKWWLPVKAQIEESKQEIKDYMTDRPVGEFDWGYVDVFYRGQTGVNITEDELGRKILNRTYGEIYAGRRYGVEDLEGDRRVVLGSRGSARDFVEGATRRRRGRQFLSIAGQARYRSSDEIRETLRALRQEVEDKTGLSIEDQYNIDINPLRQRQELHNRLMYEDRILMEALAT